MKTARILPSSLGLAVLLAACGGGGGGGAGPSGEGGPPPAASTTQIVVQPTSLADLERLCGEKGSRVIGPVEGTGWYRVEVPAGATADQFLHDMEGELEVEGADDDRGVAVPEGGGSTVPVFVDDGFDAIAIQSPLQSIGALAARGRGFRGAGVVVAVLDTGVVPTHPSLVGHVAPDGFDFVDDDPDPTDQRNFLDDDGDGLVDEGFGHGTFVASLVLAVAPDATILPIRVLNSDAVGTASSVARGIAWAVSHGADVINLSAGLLSSMPMIDEALANARSAGVLVFACAGNRGTSAVDYPALASAAVGVTALDAAGVRAPFASFDSSLDLSAPGVDLLGAHPLSPSGTARWSGTSFSTALATGAFAVLRGRDFASKSEDLVQRLENTAVSVDALNPMFAGRLGRGRVDLDRATQGP